MNIKKFVKERNEAIFSLEKEKIVAYCKKYDVSIPENEQVFWAGVYKSILAIENSPEHLRQKAIDWLDEHGFKRTIFKGGIKCLSPNLYAASWQPSALKSSC